MPENRVGLDVDPSPEHHRYRLLLEITDVVDRQQPA